MLPGRARKNKVVGWFYLCYEEADLVVYSFFVASPGGEGIVDLVGEGVAVDYDTMFYAGNLGYVGLEKGFWRVGWGWLGFLGLIFLAGEVLVVCFRFR
jgi:hypothetical protein